MLQINIMTRSIRLDYSIQNAQLNLKTSPSRVEIETTPAELEIRQPRGELTIDSTPYYYSIGRKNMADFARDNADLGKQTVLDSIAQIVEEGNQMARIQDKRNVIAEIALNASLAELPEITLAPIAAPSIRYQANPAQINFTPGKVNLTPQFGTLEGVYQPGKVDIRVTQYPSVEISTVDVEV